jgi:hypothetical protein
MVSSNTASMVFLWISSGTASMVLYDGFKQWCFDGFQAVLRQWCSDGLKKYRVNGVLVV